MSNKKLKHTAPFLIYDAAAGSGKTFTLVKEYLALVLQNVSRNYYQHLLALTFTNKAVAEMKSRIIDNLVAFANLSSLEHPTDMLLAISDETQLSIETLHNRAKRTLVHLLHNYAAFTVETIDSFNHRLIRTFARDLNLPPNFEVVLDFDDLLSKAVDALIDKAGAEEEITKALIDYTLEKTNEDKSWDISRDIFTIAKLLQSEDDALHIENFKEKSLKDFNTFKQHLIKKKTTLVTNTKQVAKEFFKLIEIHGLSKTCFNRGSFFTYFERVLTEEYAAINFDAAWVLALDEKPLYAAKLKKEEPALADTMDALTSQFIAQFVVSKKALLQLFPIHNILYNLTPLSVIHLVQKELLHIQEEQNLIPISQFNNLIYEEIKDQPVPFIYERLGERYHHYFIDEFQDTSVLQWQNMVPLIDNRLSQSQTRKDGSLLLVGDVKQSIYRWRGGNPEQFLGMIHKQSPFAGNIPTVENLPRNYRSANEIINFNNDFFSFIADNFNDPNHTTLYKKGNQQETNNYQGGYVALEFIVPEDNSTKDDAYGIKTLETIHKLTHEKKGKYQFRDICILTRSKKDGIALSTYLMKQGIPVVSAETLLISNSTTANCIIDAFIVSHQIYNNEAKARLLDFLYDHLQLQGDKHSFIQGFVKDYTTPFSKQLALFNIHFSTEHLQSLSYYEGAEYIIRCFQLAPKADAYVFGLLDFIYEFEQRTKKNSEGFLEYWEAHKNKAAIATAQNTNGVRFMTAHKAKGLEFPVVIFPYADVHIYYEREPKVWYPLEEETQNGFNEVLINFKSEIQTYNETGTAIYNKRRNTLELDSLNILYVILTRPVDQLYIFTEKTKPPGKNGVTSFNHFFYNYLNFKGIYNENQLLYTFGNFTKNTHNNSPNNTLIHSSFISSEPNAHGLQIITTKSQLWNTAQERAITAGNLFHDVMQLINTKNDMTRILEDLALRSILPSKKWNDLKESVEAVITHPLLARYFDEDAVVENERDIITKEGYLLRPDRLNFQPNTNEVTIIDYKTGTPGYEHEDQINGYATALIEMGFTISEKILVYINEEIVVNKI